MLPSAAELAFFFSGEMREDAPIADLPRLLLICLRLCLIELECTCRSGLVD